MKLKINTDIRWDSRYSETMDDDKQGRWARIAYAGDFKKGFHKGKPCTFELAWVKKVVMENDGDVKFSIKYNFPSTGKMCFDTLEEAKKEVENRFKFFLQFCVVVAEVESK